MVDQTLRREFFPYPLRHGETIVEWSTKYLAPSRDEAKFLALLSLYGSNGVPLRDLITFATLRTSCKPSENHWLLNGEAGPILRPVGDSSLPTQCTFLTAFVHASSDYQSLEKLQNRLSSLGLIEVNYPMGRSFATKKFELVNELDEGCIWRVAKNPVSSHLMAPTWQDQDGEGIVMDLLYVFLEMPSKDVCLLAERHRETFYMHARIFVLETIPFCQTILHNARDYVVALVLEILTHRFQNGDNRLIQLAKTCPSAANGFDWAIMLLWAELKGINSSEGLKIKNTLNISITRHLSRKGKRQCRANGFIGYLLVEWRKAAEASQDRELSSRILKHAMDWVETAWSSGSSIECAALCCVLANFRMLDEGVLVSPRYRLLYGYHLSRAGYLEQAKDSLASALHYYTASELSTRLSGYCFELVSVLVRLGNRQQAKELLYIIEHNTTISPKMEGRRNFVSKDRQYEHGILSDLYQAELLMATGDASLATSRLTSTIRTSSRKGCCFRWLLLAVELRLLELRTWNGSLKSALGVAEALIIEIRDNSSLDPDMMQWIMQQLLTLGNRLLGTGNVSDASWLLDKIVNTFHYQHCSHSLKDLLQYTEQRIATVSNLLSADHAENDPAAVVYESRAATNGPLDVLDGLSNEQTYTPKQGVTDSAGIIARAPHNNAEADAINTLLDDSGVAIHGTSSSTKFEWDPMRRPVLGTGSEAASIAQNLLNERRKMEWPRPPNYALYDPTKKATPKKSVALNMSSRRDAFTSNVIQRGPRSSVAAMLRQAPNAPTTELSVPVKISANNIQGDRSTVPTEGSHDKRTLRSRLSSILEAETDPTSIPSGNLIDVNLTRKDTESPLNLVESMTEKKKTDPVTEVALNSKFWKPFSLKKKAKEKTPQPRSDDIQWEPSSFNIGQSDGSTEATEAPKSLVDSSSTLRGHFGVISLAAR